MIATTDREPLEIELLVNPDRRVVITTNQPEEARLPANYLAAIDAMRRYLEEETDEIWRARCNAMTDEEKFQELATQARISEDHSLQKCAAKIKRRAERKLAESTANPQPKAVEP